MWCIMEEDLPPAASRKAREKMAREAIKKFKSQE